MRGRPRDGDRYCGVERFVPIELKRHLPGGDRAFRRYGHAGVLGRFGCNLHTHCLLQAGTPLHSQNGWSDRMIFKIIAFLAAAIPIFLFIRSIFFRRTTRINEGLREFKKQANLAVSIFLFLIVCVVVFAAGKLAWTWWLSL